MTWKSELQTKRTLVSILLVTLTILSMQTATIGTIPNVLGSTTVHKPTTTRSTSTSTRWTSTSKRNSVTTSATVTNPINSASTTSTTPITTTATTTSTTATTPTTATAPTSSTTDTIGGTSGGDNALTGELIVYPITASGSGTLASVGANVGYQDGNIATAIYSTFNSATGALSGLLGQSASTVPALGWNDLSILGGISIVSGTTYYIALQTHGSSIDFQKSGTLYYEPLTYGSFPSTATLTAVTVNNNLAFNMRMTYSSDSVSTSTTTQPTTTGTTTVASTTTTTSVTSPYTSTSTTSSTTITSATSSTLTSTSSSQTIATNSQPCSYEVFMQGTTTYAENCLTGLIVYSGTAPETVINDAISALPSGGKIFIEAGTYTFTTDPIGSVAAIGTTSINDIELYGAGNSTILAAGTNLNAGMIGVLNANGWYIHDLQINGNRASQSAGGASGAYQTGIVLYDSSNDVVEHCYVHDEKTYGISAEEGSGNQILDNWVVNSDANGIIMYGGSNGLVEGNTVDGASDVGISISGTSSSSTSVENMLCTGNTVLNINLDISPFDANSATGIMVGDNGADSNVTVSNNYVSTLEFGVSVDPASGTNVGVLVSGNTVQSTTIDGVYAEHTTTLTISDNTFTFSSGVAINIGVDVSGDAIQNNTTTTTTT